VDNRGFFDFFWRLRFDGLLPCGDVLRLGLCRLYRLDKARPGGWRDFLGVVFRSYALGHFHRYGIRRHTYINTLAPSIIDHALVIEL